MQGDRGCTGPESSQSPSREAGPGKLGWGQGRDCPGSDSPLGPLGHGGGWSRSPILSHSLRRLPQPLRPFLLHRSPVYSFIRQFLHVQRPGMDWLICNTEKIIMA